MNTTKWLTGWLAVSGLLAQALWVGCTGLFFAMMSSGGGFGAMDGEPQPDEAAGAAMFWFVSGGVLAVVFCWGAWDVQRRMRGLRCRAIGLFTALLVQVAVAVRSLDPDALLDGWFFTVGGTVMATLLLAVHRMTRPRPGQTTRPRSTTAVGAASTPTS